MPEQRYRVWGVFTREHNGAEDPQSRTTWEALSVAMSYSEARIFAARCNRETRIKEE